MARKRLLEVNAAFETGPDPENSRRYRDRGIVYFAEQIPIRQSMFFIPTLHLTRRECDIPGPTTQKAQQTGIKNSNVGIGVPEDPSRHEPNTNPLNGKETESAPCVPGVGVAETMHDTSWSKRQQFTSQL
jgi:hypothetical protein